VAALRLAAGGIRRLYLVNRTEAKAEALAREVRRRYRRTQVAVGYPAVPVDLLLNATPLGLRPADPLPLEPERFPLAWAVAVYDMVYRPPETRLLRAARQAGCRVANGLGMLLHQGAKALEIWTGRRAPLEIMRRALERHVYGAAADSPRRGRGAAAVGRTRPSGQTPVRNEKAWA
jgi:shikimate dehydrogenase